MLLLLLLFHLEGLVHGQLLLILLLDHLGDWFRTPTPPGSSKASQGLVQLFIVILHRSGDGALFHAVVVLG